MAPSGLPSIRVELAPTRIPLNPAVTGVTGSWVSPPLQAFNGRARDLPGLFRANFELPGELGRLELEWIDGRAAIDRDHELAAEALCRNIAYAVRRIQPGGQSWITRPIPSPIHFLAAALARPRGRNRQEGRG